MLAPSQVLEVNEVVLVWRARFPYHVTNNDRGFLPNEVRLNLQGDRLTNFGIPETELQGPAPSDPNTRYHVVLRRGPGQAAVGASNELTDLLLDQGLTVPADAEETDDFDDLQVVEAVSKHTLRLDLLHELTAASRNRLRRLVARLAAWDLIEVHTLAHDTVGVREVRRTLEASAATSFLAGSEMVVHPSNPESTLVRVPGEHGFRFFPSYYRHLRSTLERIPLFESDDKSNPQLTQKLSGRTVIDNLVNTPVQALAGSETNPMLYPRTPTKSLFCALLQLQDVLQERGYRASDIQYFILRLMRFMTTGSKRREAELEDISWWDYLRGRNCQTDEPTFQYSERFAKDVTESPRVLAAFDGLWGDARTNGSTFVQLILNQLIDTPDVDQVLNAPSTEAWFEHWQKYLQEYLDVRIVDAKAEELVYDEFSRRVWPKLTSLRGAGDPGAASALDPVFDDLVQRINRAVLVAGADGVTGPTSANTGALFTSADLSPVQVGDVLELTTGPFPLRGRFRIVAVSAGRVSVHIDSSLTWSVATNLSFTIRRKEISYYVVATDAPAAERLARSSGLPAVHRVGVAEEIQQFVDTVRESPAGDQPAFPRSDGMFGAAPWDRFQTLTGIQFYFRNVVRLFDGHVYFMDAPWALSSINQQQFWRRQPISRRAPYRGVLSVDIGRFDDAWALKKQTIAKSVWEQITAMLADYWRLPQGSSLANALVPDWYHLDTYIDLRPKAPRNRAPYLIPITGDWRRRPGADPWDPGRPIRRHECKGDPQRIWQSPSGGYRVHWHQWLFAGTYLRHFTRMTTMEAANESARHVVNSILSHQWYQRHKKSGAPAVDTDSPGRRRRRYQHGIDPFRPHATYLPTPDGDYCHIWNIEDYEHPDLAAMREADDRLFDRGRRHVWDFLGQEQLSTMVSTLAQLEKVGLVSSQQYREVLDPLGVLSSSAESDFNH